MNKEEFKKCNKMSDFTKRCLKNESFYDFKGSIEIINNYWKKAQDFNTFFELVKNDLKLSKNQGYWELMKENLIEEEYKTLFLEVYKKDISKIFHSLSEAGNISIGNDSFRYNISNNYGDCENTIVLIEKSVNIEGFDFLTSIKGTNINIYNYDCGNEILTTLNGEYLIYNGNKFIIFVKN